MYAFMGYKRGWWLGKSMKLEDGVWYRNYLLRKYFNWHVFPYVMYNGLKLWQNKPVLKTFQLLDVLFSGIFLSTALVWGPVCTYFINNVSVALHELHDKIRLYSST